MAHPRLPGTDSVTGRVLTIQEMTRDEYIHAWHYLNDRIMKAGKDGQQKPLTEEEGRIWQRVRDGELPWQTFSRLRGYTEDEIVAFERWKELTPDDVFDALEVDFDWDVVDGKQTITNPELMWNCVHGRKKQRFL